METTTPTPGTSRAAAFGPIRMFWTGVALCAVTIVADIAQTAVFLDATTSVPAMGLAIVNRVTTLLTVLGPAMMVGALVVDLIESRADRRTGGRTPGE